MATDGQSETLLFAGRRAHPIVRLLVTRSFYGVFTLFVASVIVFLATRVLPGNAALAILGPEAAPEAVRALEIELQLDRGPLEQYGSWIGGLLTGDAGTSLSNQLPVWDFVYPRLINSAVLVILAGLIGTVIAVALGVLAALRRDKFFDQTSSVIALAVTALPDFVVAIGLIMLLSTVVLHVLPGVSVLAPGVYGWNEPELLILPVLTLVIVIIPYIFRSMRAAMIEALESEYTEMARLKGLTPWRTAMVHAMPNAIAPTIQVIGITFLYLAGGIVLVEFVFAYPGVGQGLVDAVNNRDVPVIQFIVLVLSAFYVVMNIISDVLALLATPRRRIPR